MIQDTPDQSGRLVERLLCPADQELSCEECFDFLDAYVELEVTGTAPSAEARTPKMRAHLEGCSACRDDHDSLLAFVLSDRTDPG
jgi:hypothetical protein